ncbi:uncharacterized protein LOC126235229 [Schistocerca nitens]|uniref:uncharacterized protein LOC126235229 n=1 Tax=Schistocerca nitens TaxID=7011 RepID=UPI0021191B42|nr:uncharacterized protein LOC126235229 [Schistocerca nitens]
MLPRFGSISWMASCNGYHADSRTWSMFSKMSEIHCSHLKTVFWHLSEVDIVMNSWKCVFTVNEIEFFGHLITHNRSTPLPDKVQVILNMPWPETHKGLRCYFGMVNFHQCHRHNAAVVLEPVTAEQRGPMAKERAPITCTHEMKWSSFIASKWCPIEAVLLAHAIHNVELAIVVDASQTTINAVLRQYIEGSWQPLGFSP